MRQYIENLTTNLINKNRFDLVFKKIKDQNRFINFVSMDLQACDISQMNPETLGKIMCSFEIGDVMASKQEIFNGVDFSGDCEEMLREIVSTCLAYKISDRLNDDKQP
jgi:hypothetical protein